MTAWIKTLIIVICAGGCGMLAAPLAAAAGNDTQIETARRHGIIGERIDGYLGVVVAGKADQTLLRKINEINNKRRVIYDKTAQRTGVTTSQIARLAGEKQIAKAAAGEFFLGEDGRWRQKKNKDKP